jgi:peptidoglycan hydrolase CwlO-like protein
MQAEIDSLIAKLTEFKAAAADLDKVKAAKDKAESELKAAEAGLKSAKAELSSTQSGLTNQQQSNQREYDTAIQTKAKELEALTRQVVTAREELAEAKAENNSALTLHKQIEASIASLRAKLG